MLCNTVNTLVYSKSVLHTCTVMKLTVPSSKAGNTQCMIYHILHIVPHCAGQIFNVLMFGTTKISFWRLQKGQLVVYIKFSLHCYHIPQIGKMIKLVSPSINLEIVEIKKLNDSGRTIIHLNVSFTGSKAEVLFNKPTHLS